MTALSGDEIMELAGQWFHTGENQHRADGYYYRSLGTPSNVRGSDLIEFARALLAAQPAVQQPKHAPTQLRDCGELMEAIKGMAAMLFGQGAAQQYPFDAWRLLESYIEQMTAIVHEAQRSAVQQPAEDAGLLDRHGKIRGDLKASAYCVGNEYKPFHPSASHVRPEWRDGWNACFVAAIKAQGGKQ